MVYTWLLMCLCVFAGGGGGGRIIYKGDKVYTVMLMCV